MKKNEVAVAPVNAVALPASDMFSAMAEDSSLGFSGMTTEDLAIPYVSILQAMSPQVKRGAQKIEGAEEGDVLNTLTGEVFKGITGITVVPCAYIKKWVEWIPQDQGGGFVKAYDNDSILLQTTKNDKNKDQLPNGHEIVTTAYHYVLLVKPDGSWERAVISMVSTQLKKSRKWNTLMGSLQLVAPNGKRFTPPMFSHSYRLTTEIESRDTYSWAGWKISTGTLITYPDLYAAARAFFMAVSEGSVKVSEPMSDSESVGGVPTDVDGVEVF